MIDIKDDDDRAVKLLEQIARNTGSIGDLDGGVEQEITIESENVNSRVGTVKPRNYIVVETADMDGANDDGTVTLQPGDTKVLVSYAGDPFAALALGANNEQGVEYVLRADSDRTVGGVTQSPLGSIGDPFSFVQAIGAAVSCEKSIEYIARADPNMTDPVDVAARLHVEVMD